MAQFLYQALDVDEVWFLFSTNTDKDLRVYASLEHRMEMARILNARYNAFPFIFSDAQYRAGTHITSEALPKIEKMYPDHHFIWAMGTDNLPHFHLWEDYETLIKNYPIALLKRPSYSDVLESSTLFQKFHEDPKTLKDQKNGVCILDNPTVDISSTHIRTALKYCPEITEYIAQNSLYK